MPIREQIVNTTLFYLSQFSYFLFPAFLFSFSRRRRWLRADVVSLFAPLHDIYTLLLTPLFGIFFGMLFLSGLSIALLSG